MNIAPKLSDYGSLFIVNKVRYYHREDVKTSMILSKILREESGDVGLFQNDEVYYDLKDTSLLDQIYSQYSRAIRNTLEFIDSVSINIDLSGHHLPKYPLEGISASDKLLELANKGLVRRLKQSNRYQEMYDIYQSR